MSLALGIGATTAIVSLTSAVMWRSLGVPDPEQLSEVIWVTHDSPDIYRNTNGSNYREGPVHFFDFFSQFAFDAMRARVAGGAQLAAHLNSGPVSVTFHGASRVAHLRPVSGNFFDLLKPKVYLGRLLAESDADPSAEPAVVVTHGFFSNHLEASADAIGKSIKINNGHYSIAGVLAPEFTGIITGENTELYTAIPHSPQWLVADSWYRRNAHDPRSASLQVIARRSPGIPEEILRAELDAAFAATWPAQPRSVQATPQIRVQNASGGLGEVRRNLGNPLYMLLGLVTLVLLIACANVANLLLTRSSARAREAALRISLGCDRGRLLRQFLTESAMIAIAGGALSFAVAQILLRIMPRLAPGGSDGLSLSFGLDPHAPLATAAVTLLTLVLFGLYPAWRSARLDAYPALKDGTGSLGPSARSWWSPGKALVLVQVALGVLLLTSAATFTWQLWTIVTRDTGFERGHLLLFDMRPGESGHTGGRLREFYTGLAERLSSVPGVDFAGLSQRRPLSGGSSNTDVTGPGIERPIRVSYNKVSAPYLSALGVPILAGRGMTEAEVRSGAKVAIVSEDLAKDLGGSPVGGSIRLDDVLLDVVGVAANARYSDMNRLQKVVYVPVDYTREALTVVVRTSIPPHHVLKSVRAALHEIDAALPMVDVYTMEQQIGRTLRRERMFAWLCGSFGILALALCVVGLYGVMSYAAARRVPEIGMRMALGATRGDVLARVLREGMGLVLGGLLLGLPLAIYGGQLAQANRLLPEGTLPIAPMAIALGAITAAAVLAVLAPAARAASIDPVKALRQG
ncbi:MAG: ADOP family duplicated permease [Bryobacteraceae bacterium]